MRFYRFRQSHAICTFKICQPVLQRHRKAPHDRILLSRAHPSRLCRLWSAPLTRPDRWKPQGAAAQAERWPLAAAGGGGGGREQWQLH